MSAKRIIKKYENRRLYDMALSRYITLEDVRRLAREGVDFRVLESKTGEDITRNILLQIILNQEANGKRPVFSTQSLARIVQLYGDAVQGLAADSLQRSLEMLAEQQELFRQQLRGAVAANPVASITELTENQLALWGRMQRAFFPTAGMAGPESGSKPPRKRGGSRARAGHPPTKGRRAPAKSGTESAAKRR